VSIASPRSIPNDDHASFEMAVADHPAFALVPARVFDLDCNASKDDVGIREVETSLRKRSAPFPVIPKYYS